MVDLTSAQSATKFTVLQSVVLHRANMTPNRVCCQHACNLQAARPFQASTKHPRCTSKFNCFAVQAAHNKHETLRQCVTQRAFAALLALSLSANPAFVASVAAAPAVPSASLEASSSTDSSDSTTPIYFGNGCFWGRQKDFVDVEKALGREGGKISAITGYAGGAKGAGPGDKVCYYYGAKPTQYEELGHAEVVQMELRGESAQTRRQMEAFADTYFGQFRKTPFGMMRLDPQDSGPAYRNVIGIPRGIDSPLFQVLKERNKNGMELIPSDGNDFERGKAKDTDQINVVYIVDSDKLPFYRAEQYHQFHNGIGKAFSKEYTVDLKRALANNGRIGPTGCPEVRF